MPNQYILAIKTDQPLAQISLINPAGEITEHSWDAMRTLSDELLMNIEQLLSSQAANWNDITGIVVFKGPGSFTGLRIGVTVATTLAYSLGIPVVGTNGDEWVAAGQELLAKNPESRQVVIEYGQEANITKPRK